MDTRLTVALARRLDQRVDVSALCGRLRISRTTFYLYERRYRAEGEVGLVPRSRAPKRHPNQTPPELEAAILAARARIPRGLDNGARSVWARMRREGQDPPTARTVHRVLVRHGLVTAQPRKRPRSSYRRFAAAQPNGCWQIDGMGWALADGSPVVIVRILDDHSRKVLGRSVAGTETGEAAWAALDRAIRGHGPPAMVLSDNSWAFNGSRRGVLVEAERRLREIGVATVAASARHPQTNGKAEREHQTLQRWLAAHPAARSIAELEALLDVYAAIYNHDRPHQALPGGLMTPDEAYAATPKAVPADHPLPPRPQISQVKVTARGTVCAGRYEVQVGRGWEGATLTVIRNGNQVAVLDHQQLVLARTIDPTRRYQPSGRRSDGKRLPRHAGAQPAVPPQREGVQVERPQQREDERP